MTTIFLCENSADGIFSAIYDANASNRTHANNYIQVHVPNYNQQLFSEYIEVKTDYSKAEKVARSLQKKINAEVYDWLFCAAASQDTEKADSIYRAVILAFRMGNSVMDHLSDPAVAHITEMNTNIGNEIQHYKGFLRFVELKNNLLLAKIHPKNNILFFLADHFSDRFPDENFAIADTGRNSLLFHAKGKPVTFTDKTDFDLEGIEGEYSANEQLLQDLFRSYVSSIANKPRINESLQRQLLPLRFRKYMTEFQ
jgi:probable DNA metabolism protein